MNKLKRGDVAALMLLLWLSISFFFPERWKAFQTIIACGAPMVLFNTKIRGKTFGTRDCNTAVYKKHEYALFFVFVICGSALISVLTYLLFTESAQEAAVKQQGAFFYTFVFSCIVPAFFEEWFIRGGVLGALARYGGMGIFACATIFAVMHGTRGMLYAAFAGLFITAFVYVTECIYLGMFLHFLNNFSSVLLSYLSGVAEYIALSAIVVLFVLSIFLLRNTKLLGDISQALITYNKEDKREVVTPLLIIVLLVSGIFL